MAVGVCLSSFIFLQISLHGRTQNESCRCRNKRISVDDRRLRCERYKSSDHRPLKKCKYLPSTSDTPTETDILSQPQPQLSSQGYAVLVVDYTDQNSLQHAVKGVQTIISTVTGEAQLELLKAAVAQGVRRFAPAEFEGPPDQQALSDLPIEQDPLDRGKRNIRAWLIHYGNRIESTVFVCGVLYERFAPGGLHSYRLGCATDVGAEGDFIINVRNLRATAPLHNQNNEHVTLCLTAAQDVARLVVRSLDMRTWPRRARHGRRETDGNGAPPNLSPCPRPNISQQLHHLHCCQPYQ